METVADAAVAAVGPHPSQHNARGVAVVVAAVAVAVLVHCCHRDDNGTDLVGMVAVDAALAAGAAEVVDDDDIVDALGEDTKLILRQHCHCWY